MSHNYLMCDVRRGFIVFKKYYCTNIIYTHINTYTHSNDPTMVEQPNSRAKYKKSLMNAARAGNLPGIITGSIRNDRNILLKKSSEFAVEQFNFLNATNVLEILHI